MKTTTHRLEVRGGKWFYGIGGLLLIVAALLRFIKLDTWPGAEWDENVYRLIGENVANTGRVLGKPDYMAAPEPYLYHPPLHFEVLGGWFSLFGSSLTSARTLAVVASLVMLVLIGLFLRRMIGNWSLLAVGLLAIDTWMIFSNRVSWIENVMLPLGVTALWFYCEALKRNSGKLFVASGVLLGLVTVYKHIGVIFLVGVAVHWIITRQQRRGHFKLIVAWIGSLVVYLGVMWLSFGNVFWTQSGAQLQRSLGIKESRGALTSLDKIIGPLLDQYAIYISTLLLAALAVTVLVVRTWRCARERSFGQITNTKFSLLFAWAWGSIIFFGLLQLRIPHYFMLLVVPLFCYLVAEVSMFWETRRFDRNKKMVAQGVLAGMVTLALLLNSNAFLERFVKQEHDNALAATAAWMSANVPLTTRVMTEESVGAMIEQPYCKIWRGAGCEGAAYIITYTSYTQEVPDNEALRRLLASATPVFVTQGFKETLTVYRLPTPIGSKQF